MNLISNAIRFSSDGQRVLVGVQVEPERVCFSIQDQGIGIAREHYGLLFQSFRQVDSGTTRKYGGAGLGLSIAKSLVDLQGGQIWFESELGKGSTFHIALPRRRG